MKTHALPPLIVWFILAWLCAEFICIDSFTTASSGSKKLQGSLQPMRLEDEDDETLPNGMRRENREELELKQQLEMARAGTHPLIAQQATTKTLQADWQSVSKKAKNAKQTIIEALVVNDALVFETNELCDAEYLNSFDLMALVDPWGEFSYDLYNNRLHIMELIKHLSSSVRVMHQEMAILNKAITMLLRQRYTLYKNFEKLMARYLELYAHQETGPQAVLLRYIPEDDPRLPVAELVDRVKIKYDEEITQVKAITEKAMARLKATKSREKILRGWLVELRRRYEEEPITNERLITKLHYLAHQSDVNLQLACVEARNTTARSIQSLVQALGNIESGATLTRLQIEEQIPVWSLKDLIEGRSSDRRVNESTKKNVSARKDSDGFANTVPSTPESFHAEKLETKNLLKELMK